MIITRRDVFKAGGAVAFGTLLPLQALALGQMETAIRTIIGRHQPT